ncbi:MAG: N-acetylgalactosamine-6-sulfatase [Planctomycetaceae bacterium]|nr:N-acetylgalactosamine-6-sulfatase [Planctomycetaceae bacterium]
MACIPYGDPIGGWLTHITIAKAIPNAYSASVPNARLRIGHCFPFAPTEEVSIAQILGEAGYLCGHFGKWHLGPVKAESPTNPGAMGFDEWLAHDNFFELNPYFSRNGGPPEQFQGESSEILIAEATHFIATAKRSEQPFFVVVWFGSPHEPYSGLERDLALYNDLPESYRERFVTLTSNETGRPTKRPLDKVLQERYAEITAMDRSIGQLRRWLNKERLRQNTLLWYCGDNGSPSGGSVTTPFRGQKGLMYDGGIRVPGIIEWPEKISEPRVADVNAVTSDMLPTICDLVGQALPNHPLDGISLRSLMDGEMTERPSPIFFWSYNTGRITKGQPQPYVLPKLQEGTTRLVKMMDGRYTRNFRNFHHSKITDQDFNGPRVILGNRYKLVVDAQPGDALARELFDLRNDRAEKNNLIETEPEIARDLEEQLRNWQQSVLNSLTGADYN